MTNDDLRTAVEAAFDNRAQLTPRNASPELVRAIESVLELLDSGRLRVAEK